MFKSTQAVMKLEASSFTEAQESEGLTGKALFNVVYLFI